MSEKNKRSDETKLNQNTSHATMLIMTIGDTTWRMFIPTIGLTILGLIIDKQIGSTPWIMILGIVIGASLSAYLVIRQIKSINSH